MTSNDTAKPGDYRCIILNDVECGGYVRWPVVVLDDTMIKTSHKPSGLCRVEALIPVVLIWKDSLTWVSKEQLLTFDEGERHRNLSRDVDRDVSKHFITAWNHTTRPLTLSQWRNHLQMTDILWHKPSPESTINIRAVPFPKYPVADTLRGMKRARNFCDHKTRMANAEDLYSISTPKIVANGEPTDRHGSSQLKGMMRARSSYNDANSTSSGLDIAQCRNSNRPDDRFSPPGVDEGDDDGDADIKERKLINCDSGEDDEHSENESGEHESEDEIREGEDEEVEDEQRQPSESDSDDSINTTDGDMNGECIPILIGKGQKRFVVPIDRITGNKHFINDAINDIDLGPVITGSRWADIQPNDFQPIAEWLRRGDFRPRLRNGTLLGVTSADQHSHQFVRCAHIFRLARQLELDNLKNLVLKKMLILDKTPSSMRNAGKIIFEQTESDCEVERQVRNMVTKQLADES